MLYKRAIIFTCRAEKSNHSVSAHDFVITDILLIVIM